MDRLARTGNRVHLPSVSVLPAVLLFGSCVLCIVYSVDGSSKIGFNEWRFRNVVDKTVIEVELHFSGLNGLACHPNIQKIRIIGFLFENRLHWQVGLLVFTVRTCV